MLINKLKVHNKLSIPFQEETIIIVTRSKTMFQLLRKLFCMHAYEYEQFSEFNEVKECRKCGDHRN